jgi:hypothetical protein
MLNGTKTMTSRSKQYGHVGDTFDAFGATFEITEVGKRLLGDIANDWKAEGMISLEDFMETWKQIHPFRIFNPEDRFFTHKFKRVDSA